MELANAFTVRRVYVYDISTIESLVLSTNFRIAAVFAHTCSIFRFVRFNCHIDVFLSNSNVIFADRFL